MSYKDPSIDPVEMSRLLNLLKDQLTKRYPDGQLLRAFHPKMHGLVKAVVAVSDDLPAAWQSTLFVPGRSYDALIRFSNGKREVSSDHKKDLRGIAIKLIGVPGKKVLPNQEDAVTQDFLLANYPIFPPGTFLGTVNGIIATSGNIFKKVWFAITHLSVVLKAIKSATHCKDLLGETYFSQVPYKFNQKFVKYVLKPTEDNAGAETSSSDNFLREQLVQRLQKTEATFDLCIQERTAGEPLNDASVEWKGPLLKIASIRIPKQEFDTPQQNALGEKMDFTPWHSLPEHVPAGDIGVARKEIYQVMSEFRNTKNLPEPTSMKILMTSLYGEKE